VWVRQSPARFFICIADEEREEKNPVSQNKSVSSRRRASPAASVRSLAPAPPLILLPASCPSVVTPRRGCRRSTRRVVDPRHSSSRETLS
jgi:hypothetical protein